MGWNGRTFGVGSFDAFVTPLLVRDLALGPFWCFISTFRFGIACGRTPNLILPMVLRSAELTGLECEFGKARLASVVRKHGAGAALRTAGVTCPGSVRTTVLSSRLR